MKYGVDIETGKLKMLKPDNFSFYFVPVDCFLCIPIRQQMIVSGRLTIEGRIEIKGRLAVI